MNTGAVLFVKFCRVGASDHIGELTGADVVLQESWDNSGLLIGSADRQVSKIGIALDLTPETLAMAHRNGVDLIVTHHPIIFKPLSEVTADSLVYKLIKNDLSIICAHTNYDKAIEGVNDILCYSVELEKFVHIDGTCLNVGELSSEMNSDEFAQFVKSKLNGIVRYNSIEKSVKRVAVCSGSGSDYLALAKELNCDALLTGDGSHHSFLDADEIGISLVCAGHFETENIAIKPLADKIRNNYDIECVVAVQKSPINTI